MGPVLEESLLATKIDRQKSRLFPFAYNITGDYLASEDIVQEVLNKHFLDSSALVINEDGYLTRSVINKAINHKNKLSHQKEQYLGQWLPAPVFTEDDIYDNADRNQIVNYSLMVLLEQLNPRERAVFILKETFDFSHKEIAETLEIEEDHSRQLLKRAKAKIKPEPHHSLKKAGDQALLNDLTNAILMADIDHVKEILHSDISFHSDGGNKTSASRNVLIGPQSVYKLYRAIHDKYWAEGTVTKFGYINHCPALIHESEGHVYRCMIFKIENGRIQSIYTMVNPDKLTHLNLV